MTLPRKFHTPIRYLLIVIFAIPLLFLWTRFQWLKPARSERRLESAKQTVPEAFIDHLEQNFEFFGELSSEEQHRFIKCAYLFYEEKAWIPMGGLEEVSKEMRTTISGCAARLARNLPLDIYDNLFAVVVYPSAFWSSSVKSPGMLAGGTATLWTVNLSWEDVMYGIDDPYDGYDVALHEFSHALDLKNCRFAGIPHLESRIARTNVFQKHFAKLCEDPNGGLLRAYGATNDKEFFAVATENFFERPQELRESAPDLYAELAQFYAIV